MPTPATTTEVYLASIDATLKAMLDRMPEPPPASSPDASPASGRKRAKVTGD